MTDVTTPTTAGAVPEASRASRQDTPRRKRPRRMDGVSLTRGQAALRFAVLLAGAIVFLFPFYYMVIGSLQREPDTSLAGAFPNPANIDLHNFSTINDRVNLLQGLLNSGIFTGGVLLCTVVFGLLAGYALAVLQWRGRASPSRSPCSSRSCRSSCSWSPCTCSSPATTASATTTSA